MDREDSEPVLLIGGKRVICPDCVKSIRLKKDTKEALDKMFQDGFTLDDFIKEDKRDLNEIVDYISKELEERHTRIGDQERFNTVVDNRMMKDINKQIRSYVAAHSDMVKVRSAKKVKPGTHVEERAEEFIF